MTAPLNTGDLWRSVDRLTLETRQRLVRDSVRRGKTTIEHVPIPSLWTQLAEASSSTTSSDGGASKGAGSPSPADLGILDLMHAIETRVLDALTSHGSPARQLHVVRDAPRPTSTVVLHVARDEHGRVIPDDRAGQLIERAGRTTAPGADDRPRHDMPAELRHLAAVVVSSGEPDLIGWWTDQYGTWVRQAESALALDDQSTSTRGMRGHACPNCGALSVSRYDDGEEYRDPALVVSFRDGQVLHATCRACTTGWWRGEGLDALAVALAFPTPVHTTDEVLTVERAEQLKTQYRKTQ